MLDSLTAQLACSQASIHKLKLALSTSQALLTFDLSRYTVLITGASRGV